MQSSSVSRHSPPETVCRLLDSMLMPVRVLARSWCDPSFRAQLEDDAESIVRDPGWAWNLAHLKTRSKSGSLTNGSLTSGLLLAIDDPVAAQSDPFQFNGSHDRIISVIADRSNIRHIVLPYRKASTIGWSIERLHRELERELTWLSECAGAAVQWLLPASVIVEAWTNPHYRAALKRDPGLALRSIGASIPAQAIQTEALPTGTLPTGTLPMKVSRMGSSTDHDTATICVLENTAYEKWLVLPLMPPGFERLTEEEIIVQLLHAVVHA